MAPLICIAFFLLLPAHSNSSSFLPLLSFFFLYLLSSWQLLGALSSTQSLPVKDTLGLPSLSARYIPKSLRVLGCFSYISVFSASPSCPLPLYRLESSEVIATFPEDSTKKVSWWTLFPGQNSPLYLLVKREKSVLDKLLASTAGWSWNFRIHHNPKKELWVIRNTIKKTKYPKISYRRQFPCYTADAKHYS